MLMPDRGSRGAFIHRDLYGAAKNGSPAWGDLTENQRGTAGELTATIHDGAVQVTFSNPTAVKELEVHVVLHGGGITSDVRRGENSGRSLRHEFLVLGWEKGPIAGRGCSRCFAFGSSLGHERTSSRGCVDRES